MNRLKVFGFASIAVALLLPVALYVVPILVQRSGIYLERPQRYHYYYFAPGQSDITKPENLFLKLVEGCFASIFFLVLGIYMLYRHAKRDGNPIPATEDQPTNL